ncbi:putative enzyme [uncultured Paludibacter sp.]|nr:putative enzyme [uncultured Paludibacter sp.]
MFHYRLLEPRQIDFMTIKTFTFNPFQENSYLVWDETNEAAIIDAGMLFDNEKALLKKFIEDHKLILRRVLNTHLHLDHQFGNKFLFETYGIAPEAGKEDDFLLETANSQAEIFGLPYTETPQLLGSYIFENQEIKFGNTTFITLHTPGHSPGSYSLYCEKDGVVFVGDVLFSGSIGRTDLPKGDYATLIKSIQNKLLPLPDSTVVYSGHGPATTIEKEKLYNPFL